MKTLSLLLFIALPSFALAQVKVDTSKKGRTTDRTPPKALEPLVYENEEKALENAKKRNQPAIIAVGMTGEGEIPPLFTNAAIARASRASASFSSVDYYPDNEFFKSRKILKESVPCILILDPNGNVLDTRPANVDPNVLLAAARNALTLMNSIQKEIPNMIQRAKDLATQHKEQELLDSVRTFLSKHYRGYAGLDEFNGIINDLGKARLAEVSKDDPDKAMQQLAEIAKIYSHTPIEAQALVEIAKIEDKKGKRDDARTLLRKVMNDLPWPENAEAHQQAKVLLEEYRKQEIKRRLEEKQKQQQNK